MSLHLHIHSIIYEFILLFSYVLTVVVQVNLFIAVLKIKFAKAQTLFHSRLAKMSKKKRKNILGRVMEKGKKRIKDQVKKKREASEVNTGHSFCCYCYDSNCDCCECCCYK